MAKQNNQLLHNLISVAIFFVLLLFVGVLGYSLILGWNWLDAIYMTIITFSTVGFKEVADLGFGGKMFTMFIIFAGLILVSLLSASVTTWFVSNELLAKRKIMKQKKEIGKLTGHTILCGAGDTGRTIIDEFIRSRKPIVVIEEKQEIIDLLREQYPDLFIIHGDATKDELLEEANIKNASGLIAALSLDADNFFIVVSAKGLNPNMVIISRSVDPHTEKKLYHAGANYVISPNLVEGMRMAAVLLRPTVVSFLDVMMQGEELSLRMEEASVPKGSLMHNKLLKDAQIPQRTGLIVIAIKKAVDSQWIFNPSSSTKLEENDKLIVLGDPEKTDKLQALLNQT